jgi:catechol 2,3-dioxygenase-like lactoylglutathione lyase family enzyme
MTIEINGMAHVILTVSRFDVARDFYRKLLPQFGMKPVFDGDKCSWAPGYYYVLFEDPDGIRLEVCFVPGAGLLAAGASFNPSAGYIGGSVSGALPQTP